MRCLSCHYDLSNLTEHRCPECGRVFDPTDSRTFNDGPVEVSTWPRFYAISFGICVAIFVVVYLALGFEPRITTGTRAFLSFFAAGCGIIVVWLFGLTDFVNLVLWKIARWRYNRL